MYKLILGENTSKKDKAIEWDSECEEAFRKLKDICTIPILAYADLSNSFKMHTDVCTLGLGAILYQNQDGVDCIIRYASRFLSETQHKYQAHKLEFLALKGQAWNNSMRTFMGIILSCTQTIIPSICLN